MNIEIKCIYLKEVFLKIVIMERAIKIIVVILLVLNMLVTSQDYHQLMSFIVIVAFGILAYNSHINKKVIEMITYVFLILVFQPFYVIALDRTWWLVIQGVLAVGLIVSVFFEKKEEVKSKK